MSWQWASTRVLAEGQKTKNTFLCWVINKTQMTPVFLLTSQNKLHQIFKQNLA